ncbi:proteasome accessory factor A [Georgenia satyanarayanai]|uniref:Pup--protein ligase n=1 Tax=Georgenia satyanarayanai TaxID=860221 RepID=A0A2Y8ZYY5_9MICO|nr:Pup--protein ligase [Georgenia satyanarayanai]PYG02354.1 proteasome accessory factor A [Georgenia satyanarayanai]SSA37235.1 proteasome accessory factor A [Georgenia satyanarayanai]
MSLAPRIIGIETEYGITVDGARRPDSGPPIGADEAARYLFRKVVEWGRSSNVFLRNGGRLYLDVGSHPEYATAECDDVRDVVVQDRAGEAILNDLAEDATARLAEEGIGGRVHLLKNNVDSAGNAFGCHENYLVRRRRDFQRTVDQLVPFFVTRQILTGAGAVRETAGGATYCFSQRSEHLWDAMSSATTRSRPIINSRDEPHGDPDLYRRLHVISGDSSVAETTTLLKLGMTALLLDLLESGERLDDLLLVDPMRSIRDVSRDLTATTPLELASGRRRSALEMQEEYLERVLAHTAGMTLRPVEQQALELWERGLRALRTGDHSLVDTELDWAIKERLVERYRAGSGAGLTDMRVQRLLLAYHDISPTDGLADKLCARGLMARVATDEEIATARTTPPQTTRAKLRGDFVAAAQERRRDHTVDWVHLKLNDATQHTVLCKDPFASSDERVAALIAAMGT